jgi:hypothetical protein
MSPEQQAMEAVEQQEIVAKVRELRPDIHWPTPEETFLFGGVMDASESYEGYMGVFLDGYNPEIGEFERVALPPRTEQYKMVPHEVIYDKMLSALDKVEEYGKPTVQVSLFDCGAKMELSARFNDTKVKVGKDQVTPEIGFRNSYDLGWQQSGYGGAYVWRCKNGMFFGHEAFAWKKKHRLNYSVDKQVEVLLSGMGGMSDQFNIWKNWAQIKMDQSKTIKLFETCQKNGTISEKQTETILALPETGSGIRLKDIFEDKKDTDLWTVNSVITQWLTHDVTESSGRREREEKVAVTVDRFAKRHLN